MAPEDSTVDPNRSSSPCSILEYLSACQPRLDDSMVREALQALKVPEDLAQDVEQEIRLVWDKTDGSAAHSRHEQVLQQAQDLAHEVAAAVVRGLAATVRLPRSEMMDSVRRRAGRGDRVSPPRWTCAGGVWSLE